MSDNGDHGPGRYRRGQHPNSLNNLPNLRGELPAGAWRPGATPHLGSGLYSRSKQPPDVIDPILDAVLEDLEAKVPVRDEHGDVPQWLREMAWSAAIAKLQVTRCARYLAQYGEVDERGRWRPENEGLSKANERYQRALERLAMTVGSHARAGLDLRRTFDLAQHWAEQTAAEEATALEGDAEDADDD